MIAQGRPLPFSQTDVALSGHAIEARLCAEDPSAGFLPSTGRIVAWRAGQGEGVRIDSGIESRATVAPHYDSLLAKVIANGATREEARRKLVAALQATFAAGVATNRDFSCCDALNAPVFAAGEATTDFVERAPFSAGSSAEPAEAFALAALLLVDRARARPRRPPRGAPRRSRLPCRRQSNSTSAALARRGQHWIVTREGETFDDEGRLIEREDNQVRFSRSDVARLASFACDGDELWLDFDGACRRFIDRTYAPPRLKDELSDGAVRSPVSGVIVGVEAKAGDRVRRGQALATVEAMKMQYSILAPVEGVVSDAPTPLFGQPTPARALLFVIEPPGY